MSLSDQLLAVTASVKQQAPAAVLATMEDATAQLNAAGILKHALQPGDVFPEFTLPNATGTLVSSRQLLAEGPLVLTFYRGAWCPYCNLELAALQAVLPQIEAAGAQLVAVSPQTPDNSLSTVQKNQLAFTVLSDTDSQLARKLGILFTLPESLRPIYQAFGIDLVKTNGNNSLELPVPATYFIGQDGVIAQAWMDVDYRKRVEPEMVIDWLRVPTTA
jgi:peroxiredoxin